MIGPMPRAVKISLFIISGFVGLLLVVAVVLHFLVNVNTYKPQLEAIASQALGVEVRVGGPLGIDLLPSLHLSMDKVQIRSRGAEIASAKSVSLNIRFLPLLNRQVRVEKVALKSPTIFLETDSEGKLNIGMPESTAEALPLPELETVSFTDGTLRYLDKKSGAGFQAGQCNLDMRRLRYEAGEIESEGQAGLLQPLSFTGQLACAEVRGKDIVASDLKVSITGKDKIIDFKPITMRLFGARSSGNIRADFSGSLPRYHLYYALPKFRIEEFFKFLSPDKVAEGEMNFSASLTMQGRSAREMKRTVDGTFLLRGENLTHFGHDLDSELARYASSQNFNLVDLGAFFLAGPVGLAVTKGYNFTSILQGSGGSSRIRTLISDWKFRHGVAQAQDVAMATKENRVALRGRIDFVHERFDDVTVALIDGKGCTKVRQQISGTFLKPVVAQPNAIKTLAGPVITLFEKARDILSNGECEVFYTGSVAAPK